MTDKPQSPETDQTHTDTPDGAPEAVSDAHSPGTTEEMFTAEYVNKLRTEAAELRVKSGKFDAFAERLFDLTAADVARELLRDASDLRIEDRAAYLDESGYPDRDAIHAAAEELLTVKPWLGKVRGDAGQGARPNAGEGFSLGAALRGAAG